MKVKFTPLTETFGMLVESCNGDSILSLEQDEVIAWFKQSSLLIFRGFTVGTDNFKAFTDQFSTDFISYVAGAYDRKMIKGDNTLLSVAGHHKLAEAFPALPFHGEMYYKLNNPEMLWFYCYHPAESGGETLFCDGIEVYNSFRPSTQALFSSKRLKYIRTYIDGSWQKIYQTDSLEQVAEVCKQNSMALKIHEDHSITTEFLRSAVIDSRCGNHKVFVNNILPVTEQERQGQQASLVRFEDDSKIPDDVLQEVYTVTNQLTFEHTWQKEDIIMFDNRRLLHARRSFSDPKRDIFVRLCNPAFSI